MPPVATERSRSPQERVRVDNSTNLADFPFGGSSDLNSVAGSLYGTAQLLVQQTAYAISGSVFSYSPEGFNLDTSVAEWKLAEQKNGLGRVPRVNQLETRAGAGSVLLGYIYNQQVKESQPSPQSVLASTGSLDFMQPVLAQYSVKPSASFPLALNIAAVDYVSGKLVTDYVRPMTVAKDLGLGLVSSTSLKDAQHMTLLSTILSSVIPTLHVYDGKSGVRESAKVDDVSNATFLAGKYNQVTNDLGQFLESRHSLNEKVLGLIKRFNTLLNTSYTPFEYVGSETAETVVVSFGSQESVLASEVAKKLKTENVGALNVRVYSPFLEEEFLKCLPETVKKVIVLGQTTGDDDSHSSLYTDVLTAFYLNHSDSIPEIVDYKFPREKVWLESEFYDIFGKPVVAKEADVSEYVFWDLDNSTSKHAPGALSHTLSLDSQTVKFASTYENQKLGGVIESQVRVSKYETSTPLSIEQADVLFVNDAKILSEVDILARAKPSAKVVIASTPSIDEIEKVTGDHFKKNAVQKGIELFAVDYEAIGENPETQGRTQSMVQQIAFWKTAYPSFTMDQLTSKMVLTNGNDTELVAATIANLAEKVFEVGYKKIEIPKEWAEVSPEDIPQLDAYVRADSFLPNDHSDLVEEEYSSQGETITEVTKKIAFREAYGASQELRPDLPVKNFVSKVKVNQRVTPEEYDRHIFHFELDITGTGLTYAIGEALGVHAPNNEQQVLEFIEWYGLNPDEVVSVPSVVSEGSLETKTLLQALRDNIDIFGKPPKKFYENLAPFAQDSKQREHLEKLASPAGAEELKKRAEEDFCTFADLFEEFTSARPSAAELVQLVAPLKRREYSIASSQKVHPNAVHLLIVVVDWVDSKGRKRYGQCSKYLSDLSPGSEVIVSVKPSVMKLPQNPATPIIMSGLGTGLAPFKAFLEEKMWQKQQGHEIGDVYLFLGARHQRQEYLYGELFEAYKNAGILTYIGAAFSRDQPQKIYIQDRIREAKIPLVDAFVKQQGSFYLCGPTWPVADVSSALCDIVAHEAASRGETIEQSRTIETLKEQERYILEVY
ncbi:hypothetical protein TRICI_004491 [Trichomonascus ciferrii]|uniref:assimilatory sulfite reductase (NADPH) n=1 Tax=Trichomonascus ciferrii TaxID=44093 RepID=A0A642V045_9ASCO|nr:hypothetical protein TRICI_004491 [Trichomonascus ciferrii]